MRAKHETPFRGMNFWEERNLVWAEGQGRGGQEHRWSRSCLPTVLGPSLASLTSPSPCLSPRCLRTSRH